MRKHIHKIIGLTLALSLLSNMGKAQPYIDLVQGFFQGAPPTTETKTFTHYRFQANLPIVMKKSKDIILINPIWEGRSIVFKDAPSSTTRLNGFITWFTYTRQLGKGRSLTLAAIPRWNGEPSIQWSQGFQMGGAGLYTWRQNPKLEFKVGLYYNREFFGNFFIPLAGLDWTFNKKDRLFGTLPGFLTYEHRINDRVAWGGAFRTFTNSYRLYVPPYANPTRPRDYFRVDDNQLGAYADLYLTPKWVLNLEAGFSILRKLRLGRSYERPDLERENITTTYIRASFQYRLRLDKPKG